MLHQVPLVGRDRRVVTLSEPTRGGAQDRAGLAAMQDGVAVAALQRQADPLGHPEDQRRQDEQRPPEEHRDVVDGHPELDGDDVIAGREHEDAVCGDRRHADGRADRGVTGPVEQVVFPLVVVELPFVTVP